MNSINLT